MNVSSFSVFKRGESKEEALRERALLECKVNSDEKISIQIPTFPFLHSFIIHLKWISNGRSMKTQTGVDKPI